MQLSRKHTAAPLDPQSTKVVQWMAKYVGQADGYLQSAASALAVAEPKLGATPFAGNDELRAKLVNALEHIQMASQELSHVGQIIAVTTRGEG